MPTNLQPADHKEINGRNNTNACLSKEWVRHLSEERYKLQRTVSLSPALWIVGISTALTDWLRWSYCIKVWYVSHLQYYVCLCFSLPTITLPVTVVPLKYTWPVPRSCETRILENYFKKTERDALRKNANHRYMKINNFNSEMAVFWDVAQCRPEEVYRRFRGTFWPHHQAIALKRR
jgi:hypothetical protein